jgi:hypothetical protein
VIGDDNLPFKTKLTETLENGAELLEKLPQEEIDLAFRLASAVTGGPVKVVMGQLADELISKTVGQDLADIQQFMNEHVAEYLNDRPGGYYGVSAEERRRLGVSDETIYKVEAVNEKSLKGAELGITILGTATGIKSLSNKNANTKPDFYVSPKGETLPTTGYRYSDSRFADSTHKNMASPGTPQGHYIGFEKLDSASQVQDKYQVSKDWSDSKVRGEFDTLQLYDQENGKWKANVPTGRGNTLEFPEPYTKTYPEYGKGGYQQYVTDPNIPITYDKVEIIGE